MNFVPKMNRRSFVVGAASVGGGLALGLNIPFGSQVVRAADGSPAGIEGRPKLELGLYWFT